MVVASRIREVRKNKGLSQKELAKLTDIAEITIRGYENSKFKPKIEQLEKIAKALDVSTNYLLGVTSKPKATVEVVQGDLVLKSEYLYLTGERFIEKLKEDYPNIEIESADGESLQVLSTVGTDWMPMKRARLLYLFNMLNSEGHCKVFDYLEDLAQINKYKEGDSDAEKD